MNPVMAPDSVVLGDELPREHEATRPPKLVVRDLVKEFPTRGRGQGKVLAIDHVDEQYQKGFGCDLNADGFPSADVKVLDFFATQRLQGVAADGVATVEALDANGTVLASTPVVNNLFVSDIHLPAGSVATIESLDAEGNVLANQRVPQGPPSGP